MGGKTHELVVTLHRDSPTEQWGFSLVGGSDVNAPLIVTRVGYRSPSEGNLQRGDIISKVGQYDARDIRHQDAQTLFSNAGNTVRVVVQREQAKAAPGSAGSSHTYSPLSVSPHLSPRGGNVSSPSVYSPGALALQPYYGLPFTPLDHMHYTVEEAIPRHARNKDDPNTDVHVVNQPYRTTPLVLPGAKVKRDAGPTESYLRHHPNPTVRARPHHLIDHDQYYKEKIVHKQFNSPINLYNEGNIADTIYKQTGVPAASVRKPAATYNPEESETYKAVKEGELGEVIHQVAVPPQAKIFTPNKVPAAKKPGPVYSLPQKQSGSAMGDQEDIHQSGSFKRLMWSVMAESSY
ncbi:PDZ and LIM domain protein 4 isoform X2 [Atheta coriaria]|uniref:PDZ and LIM domain protein 4 isoform X2 n=1 Tax=Dalotia coriaria TaxID=877792 RepID=UPI0031F3414F